MFSKSSYKGPDVKESYLFQMKFSNITDLFGPDAQCSFFPPIKVTQDSGCQWAEVKRISDYKCLTLPTSDDILNIYFIMIPKLVMTIQNRNKSMYKRCFWKTEMLLFSCTGT